jgi:hypothetical protein
MNPHFVFPAHSQKPQSLFNFLGAPLNGFFTKVQKNISPQDLTGFVVQPQSFVPRPEPGPSSSSYNHMRAMTGAKNGKKFEGFVCFFKVLLKFWLRFFFRFVENLTYV